MNEVFERTLTIKYGNTKKLYGETYQRIVTSLAEALHNANHLLVGKVVVHDIAIEYDASILEIFPTILKDHQMTLSRSIDVVIKSRGLIFKAVVGVQSSPDMSFKPVIYFAFPTEISTAEARTILRESVQAANAEISAQGGKQLIAEL